MKLTVAVLLVIVCGASFSFASGKPEQTLIIHSKKAAGSVSPMLYGLMTEAINHSYDGGLYAELIKNRAFLDNSNSPVDWSIVETGSSSATMALDSDNPLNDKIPTSLRLHVTRAGDNEQAGIANDGYWGIPVRANTKYSASFYAKAAPGFSGSVVVSIQSTDGSRIYASGKVAGITQQWKKYTLTIQTGQVPTTAQARYAVTLDKPGTVWFSIISLFPPTWNNQPNGFRKDLMQMLVDMKPKFLRFPGGNFLEGNTIKDRFNWKDTIGPIDQRSGHEGPWGYRSTDGMGLLEFLKWCEDLGAQPVLGVYAGYSLNGSYVDPGADLAPYVQDALDEIQYVSGPPTSKWGAVRAHDGHPAPFELKYVEIGNEDWFDSSGSYDRRFTQFYDAIKKKYPQIQVISTVGNEHPAYQQVQSRNPDVLDEHYYLPADTFLKDSPTHFKRYDRTGPRIFVGEWASYETSFPPWDPQSKQEPPTPNMKAALGDAAWMLAMERNSDLVIMQCYAPLLVNVNGPARQWRPDLIGYNALHAFASPSYYAIRMFSTNLGDQILSVTPEDTQVQSAVTRNSLTGETYIKMLNAGDARTKVKIELEGVSSVDPTGTATTLSANTSATNSIDHPDNVLPVTSEFSGAKRTFHYDLPPHAIVVLKLKTH
jgi:alpha-N-arabinofuranosidase